jgi:hypothetical protein
LAPAISIFPLHASSRPATRTDKVTRGRGLARVDVADNDEVDVVLLLAHLKKKGGK